jgi:hypothetical protein
MEDSGGVSVADLVSRSAGQSEQSGHSRSAPPRPQVTERPPASPQAPTAAQQAPAAGHKTATKGLRTPTGGGRPAPERAKNEWALGSLPTQREASDFSLPGVSGAPPATVTTVLSPLQLSAPTRAPRPQQEQPPASRTDTHAVRPRTDHHAQRQAEHRHPAPALEEVPAAELTDELEPINETTAHIRRVDETLRRFAAVHEEVAEEERRKRSSFGRLRGLLFRGDEAAMDDPDAGLDHVEEFEEFEDPDAEQTGDRHRTRQPTSVTTKVMAAVAVLLVLAVAVILAVVAT